MPVVPDIEARSVVNAQGHVGLFDLWVAGRWVGSTRTAEQAEDRLSFLCGVPVVATNSTPW